jgi:hypothetical protein
MVSTSEETASSPPRPEAKNLRVKLPMEILLRLQEIRIREGRSVAAVVKAALEEYFERELGPKGVPPRAPTDPERHNAR